VRASGWRHWCEVDEVARQALSVCGPAEPVATGDLDDGPVGDGWTGLVGNRDLAVLEKPDAVNAPVHPRASALSDADERASVSPGRELRGRDFASRRPEAPKKSHARGRVQRADPETELAA